MIPDRDRKHVAETARFDDSFATHMIRDFFLVLVTVVIIELSVRFSLVVYDFHHNQELTTQIEAERLAADIKSIMLNSGGPVAARTVYPILDRIVHVIQDLSDVLANVLVVNRRLTQVHDQMESHFKEIDVNMTVASENALRGQSIDPLLSRKWLDVTRMLATTLQVTSREGRLPRDFDLHVERFCETLEAMAEQAERLASRHDGLTSDLKNLSGGLHEFRYFLEEMAVLEEKMRGIASQGQTLLTRLTYVEANDAGEGVECAGVTP